MASTDSCVDGDVEAPTGALGECQYVSLVLALLAAHINGHPKMLQAVDSRLVERINSLLLGIEVDLDAPLQAEDE
jgi:antitoxin PrlF